MTPAVYTLLKSNSLATFEGEIGAEMRKRGVIAMLDGMSVVRVPAARLPKDFGFMLAHPSATVCPVKLAEFKTHMDPPGVSGVLCEGRIVYDAFVLENKAKGIYYQSMGQTAAASETTNYLPAYDPDTAEQPAEG